MIISKNNTSTILRKLYIPIVAPFLSLIHLFNLHVNVKLLAEYFKTRGSQVP